MKQKPMRIIGHRKEQPVAFHASADLLLEGARFNDEIHRMPSGQMTRIPKGVFRFSSHEAANRQQQDCLVKGMAEIALERSLKAFRQRASGTPSA